MESGNKQAALEFLRLCSGGQVREAYARYAAAGFRHHNPHFKSDAESLMLGMEQSSAENPETRLEVQRALQEGELGAVHSRVRLRPDDAGIAVVHLFRFERGRIAEFWDVIMPPPDKSPNELGLF